MTIQQIISHLMDILLSIEGIKNITSNLLLALPNKLAFTNECNKSDSGDIISIRGKADYAEVMKGDYDHTHEPTCKGWVCILL